MPATHALLALMLLHSSRLPARVDSGGALCLLEEQDRTLWDQSRIAAGINELSLSINDRNKPRFPARDCNQRCELGEAHPTGLLQRMPSQTLTQYHAEAAIAACHALAPSFAQTNWVAVLQGYDDLALLNPSPVVLLNRSIALAMVFGPEKGMEQLDVVESSHRLESYYLLPATKAKFHEMMGKADEARESYEVALQLAQNPCERAFLKSKLDAFRTG